LLACGTTTLLECIRQGGGADAWSELVRRYWRVVFGYARRQGLSEPDAEDFTQEILSELVRTLHRFEIDRTKGGFRSFLFTMVRRRLIDRGRVEARRPRVFNSLCIEQVELPDEPFEEEWRRSLLLSCLDEAARAVEPRTFQAFQLIVIEGWPPKQAAAFLEMTVDSVYQAKARVLRHARAAYIAASQEDADG